MAILREVQENPVTRAREVTTYNVPDCFASILDKKINDVALNCLEQFVDWVLSNLYTAYTTLYELKSVMQIWELDIANTEAVSIHRFRDGTPLYDFTVNQEAGVRHTELRDLIQRQNIPGPDFLTVRIQNHARRVLFTEIPELDITFSRQTGTQYVVVQNHEQNLARFFITEHEREGEAEEKQWVVHTNNLGERILFQARFPGSRIPIGPQEELYLASPLSPPATEMHRDAENQFIEDSLQRSGRIRNECREIQGPNGLRIFTTLPAETVVEFNSFLQIDGKFVVNVGENHTGFDKPRHSISEFMLISPHTLADASQGYMISYPGCGKGALLICNDPERGSKTLVCKPMPFDELLRAATANVRPAIQQAAV